MNNYEVIYLENIIKEIINIDSETVKTKEKLENIKKENAKILKENMDKIEEEMMKEAKLEGQNIYEKILEKGKEEIKKIEEKEKAINKEIEMIYREEKGLILNKIFNQVFNG